MWYPALPSLSACGTLAEVYRWEFLLLIQRDRKKTQQEAGLPPPHSSNPSGDKSCSLASSSPAPGPTQKPNNWKHGQIPGLCPCQRQPWGSHPLGTVPTGRPAGLQHWRRVSWGNRIPIGGTLVGGVGVLDSAGAGTPWGFRHQPGVPGPGKGKKAPTPAHLNITSFFVCPISVLVPLIRSTKEMTK